MFDARDATYLTIRSQEDVSQFLGEIARAAGAVQTWVRSQASEPPLEFLRRLKFDRVGYHPIDGHQLNFIEQVNQTWTYAVAIVAAGKLLELHPDADGFLVAPGAHMSIPLDIVSGREGYVGAETFAAVNPRNNRKLARDLAKMQRRTEQHRYVFFLSPGYPGLQRRPELDSGSVQVWSVDV